MQIINHKGMGDTFWESIIMYALVAYSVSMNFVNVSPPPIYVDSWLQVFLHTSQFIAAAIAIILGMHTCYEKFFKKKR